MSVLDLFTLNISGPSVNRAHRILEFLADIDPDIIVLTETRSRPGTEHILRTYRRAGYEVTAPRNLPHDERGVAIVSRVSTPDKWRRSRRIVDLPHRLVTSQVLLPHPVTLVAAYVPSRDASRAKIKRKRTFLEQMGQFLHRVSQRAELILFGDLNIVDRNHTPRHTQFRSWEYDALAQIADSGLIDAFNHLYPQSQEHSWIGRTGLGYRYDYGFLTPGLLPFLEDCSYVHESRHLGLSDHAGVHITLKLGRRPKMIGGGVSLGSYLLNGERSEP